MASVKLIDRGVAFWKRSPLTRRLVRGNLWALGGAGSARALGLLASIFVARVLGKVHFGEFGMIQSTVGLLGTVAGVGLGSTATKYVAEHRTTDRALTGRIIALSSLVSWLAGGAMTVLLLLLAPWLAVHSLSAPQLAPQLRVGALLLFFGGINGAQTGSLYGFEAFKAVAHINVWVGLLTFPCLVVGVHYGGLIGAVWGLVANLIIGCAANYVCLQGLLRRNNIQIQWRGCLSEIPIVWKFSLPVILQSLTITPLPWLSSTFLAATPGGYAALGSFSVGTQWRNAILFVPWIFGNTALPALSNLHGGEKCPWIPPSHLLQYSDDRRCRRCCDSRNCFVCALDCCELWIWIRGFGLCGPVDGLVRISLGHKRCALGISHQQWARVDFLFPHSSI